MDLLDSVYPARVLAAAARLDALAEQLAVRGARLSGGVATCHWDGAGAAAFRAATGEALLRARGATADLSQAAAALRRHALVVGHELEQRRAEELRGYREAVRRAHDLLDPGHR